MVRFSFFLTLLCTAFSAHAEQFVKFGAYEVHYVTIPTTFLKSDVASNYGIVRGKNRSMVNISILEGGTRPVRSGVSGSVTNLLGQERTLPFRVVEEGEAIYYLAEYRHSDEEHLRFSIDIDLPDGNSRTLDFQQKVYAEN